MISKLQRGIVAPYLPKPARVHAIANPIDAPDLGRKLKPASGDFVFVGRISPEKGPFLFADAARRVGIVPVYVGDGPAADELKARYPEAKVLGWQPPDVARAKLREARALIFPSLWYEGQPLSVLEAKALGTPVIVSDVCAGREAIENGVSGLWFKSGDAEALARAILLLKRDTRVAGMSLAAYADYWRDPPTLAAHVKTIVALYCQMLGLADEASGLNVQAAEKRVGGAAR